MTKAKMPGRAKKASSQVSEETRAITIGQPWAELILRHRKLFEIRSWTAKYKGLILIHAGLMWNKVAADRLDIAKDEVTFGAFVGVANLTEIRPFTKSDAKLLKDKRGGLGGWGPGDYAWALKSVHRITSIPFKGQLGLYRPPRRVLRRVERDLEARRKARRRHG